MGHLHSFATLLFFIFPTYYHLVISFLILVYLWELYLDIRQHAQYRIKIRPQELTWITQDEFQKAQAYGYEKSSFGMFRDALMMLQTFAILHFEINPYLWQMSSSFLASFGFSSVDSSTLCSLVFFSLYVTMETIIGLPFSFYQTFVIEARHGFNKTTLSTFVTDAIKGYVLTLLIGCPVIAVILVCVTLGGEYFYLYQWGLLMVIQFIMILIFPTFIQPCFNKLTPLPEGPLRTRIEALASKIKFPLTELFVIDGSRRSSHSNAYFYGLFKWKKIVLFDTLLNQCREEEIEAILGHELGHWKLNHTIKHFIISQTETFLIFYTFSLVMNNAQLYSDFGFDRSMFMKAGSTTVHYPPFIGLLLFQLLLSPIFHVLSFLQNLGSRHFEFQADHFAAELGYSKELITGLQTLQKENKSTMVYDPIYAAYHLSHPPVLERIAALKNTTKKSE